MIDEKMVQCIGKHSFDDRALAQRVADQQNRRKDRARVSIYTCQVCGSIHIGRGNKLNKDRRGERC